MDQPLIIALVALLLALVVVAAWRLGPPAAYRALLLRLRAAWRSPTAHTPGSSRSVSQAPPWYARRGRTGILLLAIMVLLGVLVLLNLSGLGSGRTAPDDEFVVRIAPFTVPDGDARTGAVVAEQLRDELALRLTTATNLALLRAPITSQDDAAQAARQSGADVVIWGSTLAGSTATSPGLDPQLTWLPNQPWEPGTWQGYDGHLTLPRHFDLASAPLNGAVVLPPLLDSLALFSRGEVDRAAEKLSGLQRDYGNVLRPELPSAIQSIIFWGQGLLPDSEAEARRARDSAPVPEHWNNLGALLLDQRQHEAARSALVEAVALQPTLVAAHVNLGRAFMNEGRPEDALPDLRTAAQLDPRPVVLASLAEALRRAGRLEDARQVNDEVLTLDPDNGPVLAERAVLTLTPATVTPGRLEWELEADPQRSLEEIAAIRAQCERAIDLIEALHADYLRRANAYGVEGRPAMQRLMEMQARRLEEELLNRRYQLILAVIEQGRLRQNQPRSTIRRFWDALRGARTPLQEAIILADAVLRQGPGGDLQYELQYQRGRAAYLSGDSALAQQAWDEAVNLTATVPPATMPARPEAHYGRARLLLERAMRLEAETELHQALAADGRFFPAHRLLATMAIEDGRLADAEEHLRWLADNQPSTAAVIELASVLRDQGRLQEAEEILLPLANRDDAASLVLLGRMYREAGELDRAQEALERALAEEPTLAEAYEEQALVTLARPEPGYGQAEQLLRQALKADPTRVSAHIELGKLLASVLGRPGEAAQEFQAAVALNAGDPLAYRRLGETLLESGAVDAAVDSFQRALNIQPSSHEAHHGLATAYLARGDLEAAAAEEQTALDLAGGNYTLAIVGLGDIARERGDYDEALRQYTAALERDPQLAGAYLGLGRTAAARGAWDIARGHYERGLEADPDNVRLLLALGNAQLAGGNNEAALSVFERAKQLAPADAAPFAGAGQALWKSGQPEAALAQLDEAVRRNPSDAETLLAIGEIYATLERPDEALVAYERAAEARKGWHEPHFRRGVLLLSQEETDAAIGELQTAVKLNDQFAQGHYWLGRAYRAAGRYAEAVRALQSATGLQSDYWEARFFLGRALDEQGNGAEAVATYTALVNEAPAADPWRVEAERELNRIQ